MKIGVELFAASEIPVKLGSFVETNLYADGKLIPRANGQDEYHLATVIPAGRRFAGSGRKYICQLDLPGMGLGPMEARPAVTVPLYEDDDDFTNLIIFIRTNLTFTLQDFLRQVTVRLFYNGSILEPNRGEWKSVQSGQFAAEVCIPSV